MNRKPQCSLEIILKYYSFISVRCRKGLTAGWPPSGGDAVWKHARRYHSIQLRLPHLRRHSLLVAAGSGGHFPQLCGSLFRRHSLRSGLRLEGNARVGADWEAQGMRRKMTRRNGKGGRRGVRRRSYKADHQLFPNKRFLGIVPAICASNSPTRYMGRYLGFHATPTHVAY